MPRAASTTLAADPTSRWIRACLALLLIGPAGCVTAERGPNPLTAAQRAELRVNQVRIVNPISYPEFAPLLQQAVERIVAPEFKGTRPVHLDITMDHYQSPSTGLIIATGGADVVAATTSVVDAASGATLAEYSVNLAAHAGGIFRRDSDATNQRFAQGYALHLKREMQRP